MEWATSDTVRVVGVNWPDLSFLLAARSLGASYDRTLTIGRQNLYADAAAIMEAYADVGAHIAATDADGIVRESSGYMESLLRYWGAHAVDSLDASNYEGATIVHDLNHPLPDELHGKYSLVFDGGSLEHIFNFPGALKSCMDAIELGGHFVTITPANNQFGHGFYQFGPDLFYQALSPANGFNMVVVLMRASHRCARWREVSNPQAVGTRVLLTSPWPSLLFMLAKRVSIVEALVTAPQQSDYTVAWSDSARPVSRLLRWYERLPAPFRRAARLAAAFTGSTSHRDHFKRVGMAEVARRPHS